MIEITHGNLIEADADALVNTVNTVGVMGKGIALQFRKAFPENYESYKRACASGQVEPGKVFTTELHEGSRRRFIVNFPTKRHWKGKSKIEDIESGLAALVQEIRTRGIESVAVPPLGCGNGGLRWNDVFPRIEKAFATIPNVRALIYEPSGSPSPQRMINRSERPKMTPGRAAVICLMSRYLVPGYVYRLSMLEIQKLAYFVQCAGEDLRLNFVKGPYGPYADNLRKVLETMDGHFIEGYGDGVGTNTPETPITVFPDAASEAEQFLHGQSDIQSRFRRVAELIEGFETPYGMELLSTVHWVATRETAARQDDSSQVLSAVQNWNERKQTIMQPGHVDIAWQRLRHLKWI